jgi:DNA-binding TFAR19-related protein (PDSD5 family)
MVKESRARALENRLIMMARTNQIRQRITEEDLISLMNAIDEKKSEEQKIVFVRRKGAFDDDDIDFDV